MTFIVRSRISYKHNNCLITRIIQGVTRVINLKSNQKHGALIQLFLLVYGVSYIASMITCDVERCSILPRCSQE